MSRHAAHRSTLLRASLSIVAIALASGACAGPSVTAVPQATVAGATANPASPTGRYQSGSDPTHLLDLLPDGHAYLVLDTDVNQDTYSIAANHITFSGESCNGARGTYQWSLLRGGDLTLTVVDDTCLARAAMLSDKLVGPLSRLQAQFPYASMQRSKTFQQPDIASWTADVEGNFWTTNHDGNVYEYRPDGSLIRSWLSGLVIPSGITVDEKGDVYIADFSDASVKKFSPTGKSILSWRVGGGLAGPTGVAHDAAGDIYVVLHRTHDHYVEKYSPTGKLLGTWAITGTGDGQIGATSGSGPEGIAVDPAGNNYVSDPDNNRIVKFDPSGKFLLNITGDGTRTLESNSDLPRVAVDSKGNVYAAYDLAIWKFDASGKFIGEWFCPYFVNLVVDTHDNLFGAGNAIIAFSLRGS